MDRLLRRLSRCQRWANNTWRSGSGAILDNPLFAQLFIPFIGSASGSGAVAGGQLGYNYQIGPWVLGVEAALSAAEGLS